MSATKGPISQAVCLSHFFLVMEQDVFLHFIYFVLEKHQRYVSICTQQPLMTISSLISALINFRTLVTTDNLFTFLSFTSLF